MVVRALVGTRIGRIRAGSGGGGAPASMRQVATRSYGANVASTINAYAMSRTAHIAAENLTSWQIKFPAWYSNGLVESNVSASLAYTAAVEYPAGTFTQIKWGGSASTTVAVGTDDTGLCDAISVAVPAGAIFWVRNFCVANGGTPITTGLPFTYPTNSTRWVAQGEACTISASAISDQTMGGTVVDGGAGAFIYPLCIVQTTANPAFGLPGDSRTVGTGMSPDANGCQGEITPSIGYAAGWINLGITSAAIQQFNSNGVKRAALLNAYCTHIINGHGAQDLKAAVGRTAAQVSGDIFIMTKLFPGKVILQRTLSPLGISSTDGWTTLANMTMDAGAPNVVTANTLIRAVPAPLAAIVDIASQTTDGTQTTKWKVDAGPIAITGDGLHCNTQGYSDIVSSGVVNVAAIKALSAVPQWSLLSLAVNHPVLWLDFSNAAIANTAGTATTSGGGPYSWSAVLGAIPYSATAWQGTQAAYQFNGTTSGLLVDATYGKPMTSGAAGITIAVMINLTSLPSTARNIATIAINGANTERAAISLSSAGLPGLIARRLDADAAITAASAVALATGGPSLVIAVFDPAVSGTANLFVNGVQVATLNFPATGNFSATASNNMAFGTSTSLYTALVARELDIFDSALSTVNRQKLEGDMAWRAGVAAQVLPANHPYRNAAPTS